MEGYILPPMKKPIPHRPWDYWKCHCSIESTYQGMTPVHSLLFPLNNGGFGVKTRAMFQVNSHEAPSAMREKYNEFLNEGTLYCYGQELSDLDTVYVDLDAPYCWGELRFSSVRLVMTHTVAREFVKRWVRWERSVWRRKKLFKAKTESIPLGELKKLAKINYYISTNKWCLFNMGNCVIHHKTQMVTKVVQKRSDWLL